MQKVLCCVTLFHLLFMWYCLLPYVVHLQTDTLYSPVFAAGLSFHRFIKPDAYVLSSGFSVYFCPFKTRSPVFLFVVSCVLY